MRPVQAEVEDAGRIKVVTANVNRSNPGNFLIAMSDLVQQYGLGVMLIQECSESNVDDMSSALGCGFVCFHQRQAKAAVIVPHTMKEGLTDYHGSWSDEHTYAIINGTAYISSYFPQTGRGVDEYLRVAADFEALLIYVRSLKVAQVCLGMDANIEYPPMIPNVTGMLARGRSNSQPSATEEYYLKVDTMLRILSCFHIQLVNTYSDTCEQSWSRSSLTRIPWTNIEAHGAQLDYLGISTNLCSSMAAVSPNRV